MNRYSYEDAIALAREAPLKLPSPSRREEIRTAVLAMARVSLATPATVRPPRRGIGIGIAVAILAVAAVAVLVLRSAPPAAPHTHATVTAPSGAHFTHRSTAPDEIVRLTDGTIDIAVAQLHAGERFRVIVGDAEVEVRGTAFEVVAAADRLISVDVHHGKVEVRPHGRPALLLVAGGSWRAEPPKRVEPPAPVEEPSPPPAEPAPKPRRVKAVGEPQPQPTPAPPPVAPARAPEELAYSEAWAAMRTKDFTRAATAFSRVMILAPDSGLAEDATFWQAVALARGQRRAQAITAFRDFLHAHPRSPHAGEGNAMLGWLLLDTGQRAEAARRFRAAVDDPRKSVRDSARSGLDATAVDLVRDDRQ